VNRRTRLFLIVAAAAVVAAGTAIGAALVLGGEEERMGGPREGYPPLVLDLGVRTDAEAVALRRAERLYVQEQRQRAAEIFARYDSPEAEIGSAFARWPRGSLGQLERLGALNPRDARVMLHLGFARFWAGRDQQAVSAWREAARVQPDSPSSGRAEDLLHPNFPRGRPLFVPSFGLPASLSRLSAPRQVAALARRARGRDVRAKLLYGVALQRLGRRVSAQRQYDAAARLAPADAEAQVAAAVVRFDKARPSVAFSRLGPLSRRFPRAQSVRFHLGLLLLWLARVEQNAVEQGKTQLERAQALGPSTSLGREAKRLLDSLEGVETS
jgi:tetratricopeptide (TPR) repeat protein